MPLFLTENYRLWLFLLIVILWGASLVYFFRAKIWRRKERQENYLSFLQHRDVAGDSGEAGQVLSDEGMLEVAGEDSFRDPWLEDNNNAMSNGNTKARDIFDELDSSSAAALAPSAARADTPREERSGIIDIIAAEAERRRVVISEEGMKLIAERGKQEAATTINLVGTIIKNAEGKFARDDGWLLLNKEKILAALEGGGSPAPFRAVSAHKDTSAISQTQAPRRDSVSHAAVSSVAQTPKSVSRGLGEGRAVVDSSLFVSWIATGDKIRPVQHIKTLRDLGTAEPFLKRVVLELDVVFRARLGEIDESVDERLMHTVSGLSNEQLEQLISVLLSTVDQSYHSPLVGIKIALLRAGEVGKRR